MGGTSPRAGSYVIYLPCHAVQRGERLCCVARGLGCRPSAARFGAPPCSYPQRASAAPLGLAGSWSRVRRWRVCVAGARGVSFLPPAPQRVPPPSVQCAAVVRSLCSVRSLAAACRCSSDGSTLVKHCNPASSVDTGNDDIILH